LAEKPGPLTVAQVNRYLETAYPHAARQLECVGLGDQSATVRWHFDETTLRPGRYIGGPTLFMAADCALWLAVFTAIGIVDMAVTSEMSIRFVRPAQGGDVLARATLDSVGGRRIVGTVHLWVDGSPDRIVAVAQGTYVRP
jgi:uncharacterized protein (TIGR00369 family)